MMKKAVASLLSTLQERKNKLFLFLLYSVFTLNVFDAFLSYHFISKEKILEEANPLWKPIIYTQPELFLILKVMSVSMLCFLISKLEKNWYSLIGLSVCFITYLSIISGFFVLCVL